MSADEGTDGQYGQLPPADFLQCMADQDAADAHSLGLVQTLGVRERHQLFSRAESLGQPPENLQSARAQPWDLPS